MNSTPSQPQLPRTLSREDFEAVASRCYAMCAELIATCKHVPSLVILGRMVDGRPEFHEGGDFAIEKTQDKLLLTALMEALVKHTQIDFVIHVTEAWVLLNPVTIPTRSIAKHPKRTEAVIFNILSKDCQVVVMNPLHRKPTRLEQGQVNFDMTFKGCMARETPPPN